MKKIITTTLMFAMFATMAFSQTFPNHVEELIKTLLPASNAH